MKVGETWHSKIDPDARINIRKRLENDIWVVECLTNEDFGMGDWHYGGMEFDDDMMAEMTGKEIRICYSRER